MYNANPMGLQDLLHKPSPIGPRRVLHKFWRYHECNIINFSSIRQRADLNSFSLLYYMCNAIPMGLQDLLHKPSPICQQRVSHKCLSSHESNGGNLSSIQQRADLNIFPSILHV